MAREPGHQARRPRFCHPRNPETLSVGGPPDLPDRDPPQRESLRLDERKSLTRHRSIIMPIEKGRMPDQLVTAWRDAKAA